jgi:hypothetical protein
MLAGGGGGGPGGDGGGGGGGSGGGSGVDIDGGDGPSDHGDEKMGLVRMGANEQRLRVSVETVCGRVIGSLGGGSSVGGCGVGSGGGNHVTRGSRLGPRASRHPGVSRH